LDRLQEFEQAYHEAPAVDENEWIREMDDGENDETLRQLSVELSRDLPVSGSGRGLEESACVRDLRAPDQQPGAGDQTQGIFRDGGGESAQAGPVLAKTASRECTPQQSWLDRLLGWIERQLT
jgi:hypothetical protein